MCFVRLKTPLLEKTNRLSPVSSTRKQCCSQGPVSADGCPSLRKKRRIKKERKREHEQQTGKMQTTGERKVKCNDMWWWKSEKSEEGVLCAWWEVPQQPESIRMVQRHLIQLLLQALSKRKGKIKLPPVECFHSAIVQTVCWPCTKHFKIDLLHVNALIKLCSRLQWSHKWFAGTCEVNLCASSFSHLLPVKQFL